MRSAGDSGRALTASVRRLHRRLEKAHDRLGRAELHELRRKQRDAGGELDGDTEFHLRQAVHFEILELQARTVRKERSAHLAVERMRDCGLECFEYRLPDA